jgi:Protein of unknown function (DUF3108)
MKLNGRAAGPTRLLAAALIFIGSTFLSASPSAGPLPDASQTPPAAPAKSISAGKISTPEMPMPFRAGEILNYRIAWAIFPNAAALQINVVERRNLLGWQTWHFRASAHSQAPARALFEVDDQFDSYTDAATLESRQYEMYLNEMGSKQDLVLHFIPVGQSYRGVVSPVIVQPGTRDPLGIFYALRAWDWQRTPEFRAPVYDGSDLYELRARQLAASERVEIGAGYFQATKISIRLFEHGREAPHTSFMAWLAHNSARTPLLVVAEMPVGNVRVELTAAPK